MSAFSNWMLACFFYATASPAFAQTPDSRLAAGLQDNSFLIEEAYNQERGVVQHILSLRRQGRDTFLGFTQEWPIGSQLHQFSYTIPYSWLRGEGQRANGFSDAMLNYRYQALSETNSTPAFAPRISFIIPTGNASMNLGVGSAGLQLNLPFSKIISNNVTLHFNAGMTSYFDVRGRRPNSYSIGGSAVYAFTREFNILLETVAEWNESVTETSAIQRDFTFTVSPGLRYAFNLSAGQLVVGAALPIRVGQDRPGYGLLGYLSFEHSFLKSDGR